MSTKIYSVESISFTLLKSMPPQLQITVMGMVTSTGWKNPQLKPLRSTPEGLFEFDFVADQPAGVVADVMQPIAATFRYKNIPGNFKGVRIYAQSNSMDEHYGKPDEVGEIDSDEGKFHGYLFAKLGRIQSKSEGPDYFLQMLDGKFIGKELPILKKTHPWLEDPQLHVHLGSKVAVLGKYDGTVIDYQEVNPLVNV